MESVKFRIKLDFNLPVNYWKARFHKVDIMMRNKHSNDFEMMLKIFPAAFLRHITEMKNSCFVQALPFEETPLIEMKNDDSANITFTLVEVTTHEFLVNFLLAVVMSYSKFLGCVHS
jgi:adenine-specific DNA methylase